MLHAILLRFLWRPLTSFIRVFTWVILALSFMALLFSIEEMRTGALQARWLSLTARVASFHWPEILIPNIKPNIKPGAKPEAVDAKNAVMHSPVSEKKPATLLSPPGPYDVRLGYTRLPDFKERLLERGFVQTRQMQSDPLAHQLSLAGIFPLYPLPLAAGIGLTDMAGNTLYRVQSPRHIWADYAAIPRMLVDSLLFIENQELAEMVPPTRNPAIEWSRLFLAALGQGLNAAGLGSFDFGGGSTLATQAEKFRHSEGGRTGSASDKLKQIFSASLRAYQYGPDTQRSRQEIVLHYLNQMPLSARANFGEINGMGDALYAWFGRDWADFNATLQKAEGGAVSDAAGQDFRRALALILALRRPRFYLQEDTLALEALTDATLSRLHAARVISENLYQAAKAASLAFAGHAPAARDMDFLQKKPVNAVRARLAELLGEANLYTLDRFDMQVETPLAALVQKSVQQILSQLNDPDFLQKNNLTGMRLLSLPTPDADALNLPAQSADTQGANKQGANTHKADLDAVVYSVLLYERPPHGQEKRGHQLRVQADSLDQPLDINDGAKLDLGSTAKLRTLVTYLDVIAEIYGRFSGLTPEDLIPLRNAVPDNLSRFVIDRLLEVPAPDLPKLLDAALDRPYSASPHETFFTGGGAHRFVNFDPLDNAKNPSLREAFYHSINLPFIRLMRDVVNYEALAVTPDKAALFALREDPQRQRFLEAFADQEGRKYLARFYKSWRDLSPADMAAQLLNEARQTPLAQAAVLLSLMPALPYAEFAALYRARETEAAASEAALQRAYARIQATLSLNDRAYLAGVHPLQIWLARFRQEQPGAKFSDVVAASTIERQASYSWLFETRHKGAQDSRIRIMLEQAAFARLQQRWAKQGYPFTQLVPSLATAIGSAADRPGSLAELMGIILSDGLRWPLRRISAIEFAAGTPYARRFEAEPARGQRVMAPEVAAALRAVLSGVVREGTARRVSGIYLDADGQPLPIGGKTGTGDHRFETYGAGGQLLTSRVVNRTATFVFYLGDRFFGSITAYVAGEAASAYSFTSALPAQLLALLEPALRPLLWGGGNH